MIVNLKLGAQRKFKYLKEQKKSDLSENNVNVASGPKVQSFLSLQFNQSAKTLLNQGQLLALATQIHC